MLDHVNFTWIVGESWSMTWSRNVFYHDNFIPAHLQLLCDSTQGLVGISLLIPKGRLFPCKNKNQTKKERKKDQLWKTKTKREAITKKETRFPFSPSDTVRTRCLKWLFLNRSSLINWDRIVPTYWTILVHVQHCDRLPHRITEGWAGFYSATFCHSPVS